MLVTSETTPVFDPKVVNAVAPSAPSEAVHIESALEQLVPVPVVVVHMQPTVHNQLGGSYIMEAQAMQVENVSCHTSISKFRCSNA